MTGVLLNVKVIPRSSRNLVREEGGAYKVYLTKPAQDGLANEQLLELLSEHLKVKRYQLEIIRGRKSRTKLLRIHG